MIYGKLKPNPYERFFLLLYRLMHLVAKGRRTIEWLNNGLQLILDRATRLPEIAGQTSNEVEAILDALNRDFPRRGVTILEMMTPFYNMSLMRIQKPVRNFRALAEKAFFWREITEIVFVPRSEVGERIKHSTAGPPSYVLDGNYSDRFEVLGMEMSDVFAPDFKRGLMLAGRIGAKYDPTQLYNAMENHFADIFPKWSFVADELARNCMQLIDLSMAHLATGIEFYDFGPLLSLWQKGNFPLGFTKQGVLVILSA